MGDAGQLATLDFYLADPQIRELIRNFGGTAAPATGDFAREQLRVYGAARYEQMTLLSNAMANVRGTYTDALASVRGAGAGPGWYEVAHAAQHDNEGWIEQRFDVDTFTAWYIAQDGEANRAFAEFYGASRTTTQTVYGSEATGEITTVTTGFVNNPNWSIVNAGAMAHRDLVGIDPNAPPRLHDPDAVGFDFDAGWATAAGNVRVEQDFVDRAFPVIFVAAVSVLTAGTIGPYLGMTFNLGTTATAVVTGAIAGAAASAASGAVSGNLSLRDMLRGALTGALSAGLTSQLNGAIKAAVDAGTIGPAAAQAAQALGRMTIQGGINALLGGSFGEGAVAALAPMTTAT